MSSSKKNKQAQSKNLKDAKTRKERRSRKKYHKDESTRSKIKEERLRELNSCRVICKALSEFTAFQDTSGMNREQRKYLEESSRQFLDMACDFDHQMRSDEEYMAIVETELEEEIHSAKVDELWSLWTLIKKGWPLLSSVGSSPVDKTKTPNASIYLVFLLLRETQIFSAYVLSTGDGKKVYSNRMAYEQLNSAAKKEGAIITGRFGYDLDKALPGYLEEKYESAIESHERRRDRTSNLIPWELANEPSMEVVGFFEGLSVKKLKKRGVDIALASYKAQKRRITEIGFGAINPANSGRITISIGARDLEQENASLKPLTEKGFGALMPQI